jgi:DNA-binding CsgD family transcriptional regulator
VQFEDSMVGRYRLLETVREYASAKATAAGELDDLLERHRAHYLDVAMAAVAQFASRDQVSWFHRLSVEYDNLRKALERSRGSTAAAQLALNVASRLWIWWQVAGRIGEGRRWITTLRDAVPADGPAHRWALFASGFLALSQREIDVAESSLVAARDAADEAGDEEIAAYAGGYLALVALFRGQYADAAAMFDGAVERHRRGGRRGMAAFHLADRAIASTLAGADAAAATRAFEESLAEARAIGDIWTESHALWGLGLTRLSQGDADAAHEAMSSSLRLIRVVGDATGVALALEGLALTTAARRNAERAAWLSGLADAFWEAIPASPPQPVVAMRRAGLEAVRVELGDQRYAAAVDKGRATDPAHAVANALGESDETHRPRGIEPDLTRREQEVAALVSQGLSNREVAERLVLSPRTVESHVERIMNRLGLNSRTQIAAWLARRQAADATEPREIP